jgi:tetratricopeptide (TPR) repeat protein
MQRLTLELPAALLHVWPRTRSGGAWDEVQDRLLAALGPCAGVFRLQPGLLAVVPVAGDPAVVDTAASYAHLFAAETADRAASEAGLLVTPGRVVVDGTAALAADPLVDDLRRRPPALQPNRVHFTTRAARILEDHAALEAAGHWETPAGRAVPLVRAAALPLLDRPWRNPELLGRPTRAVARPALAAALATALTEAGGEAAFRVEGPLGVGKTRAVVEAAAAGGGTLLYARVPAPRSARPGLGLQIVTRWLAASGEAGPAAGGGWGRALAAARSRLLGGEAGQPTAGAELIAALLPRAAERRQAAGAGALTVVCDDVENARAGDFDLLAQLATAADPVSLRLVLVARSGTPWPAPLAGLPRLEVPPLDEDEARALAADLLGGLSAPEEVRARFLAAAAGNPFCLEEGIAALIHAKQVRASYGNFFFGGDPATPFEPSPRLVQHAEAEAARLGVSPPLHVLAAGDGPLPPAEVRSALTLLGGAGDAAGGDWEEEAAAAGWLAAAESPWGPGVAFRVPALGRALAGCLAPAAATAARRALGELLAEASTEPRARWQAYRLLAGSAAAVPLLLRLAEDEAAPGADLFPALAAELVAHRRAAGEARGELALLLALVPLGLRLGRLEGLEEEIARAQRLAAERGAKGVRDQLAAVRFLADLERRRGRAPEAEEALRAALQGAAGVADVDKAGLLLDLADLLLQQKRFDEAERLLGVLAASLTRGEPAAACRFLLGNLALHRNRHDEALAHHQAALAGRRAAGARPRPLVASLTALGAVHLALGRYSEALAHYAEAEDLARRLGDEVELAFTLLGLGRVLSRIGDFTAAAGPLRQALALRERAGDRLGEAVARLEVAENLLALDQPKDALRAAREAHFRLSLAGAGAPMARAERLLGRVLLARRRLGAAHGHLAHALELDRERGDHPAVAFDHAWLLEEAMAAGRAEDVRRHADALAEHVAQALAREAYPDLGERLDLRVHRALTWLLDQGSPVAADPVLPLQRAYAALMRKVGHLEPELRQRFLYQVAENRAIVEAATRAGLGG